MTTEVKFRRGTKAQHDLFTGAAGEITVETDNNRVHIHDAVKAGGFPTPNFKDLQDQAMVYAAATGTNTLTITLAPAPAAYVAGQRFSFKAANNNTGAVTLNVNGLGAKTIKKNGGADDLAADDLVAGQIVNVEYDGTDLQVTGGGAVSSGLAAPDFTSAEQTLTADTLLNVAHGLGVVPTLVQVVLRCKTADTGYAVGDEVVFYGQTTEISAIDRSATIMSDATNVSIVQGISGPVMHSKATFNASNPAPANWKWVVKAWK